MNAAQRNVEVKVSLPVLRRGASGEPTVGRLQFLLNATAGVGLAEDGVFGGATERAVRQFQDNEDLNVDGIVGRQTWSALLRRWFYFSEPS